jgi:hypothetical protein
LTSSVSQVENLRTNIVQGLAAHGLHLPLGTKAMNEIIRSGNCSGVSPRMGQSQSRGGRVHSPSRSFSVQVPLSVSLSAGNPVHLSKQAFKLDTDSQPRILDPRLAEALDGIYIYASNFQSEFQCPGLSLSPDCARAWPREPLVC